LKFKSDVFQKFHEFQNLVERLFNRKIIAIQSDWGGEYEKLNSFFTKIGISHQCHAPTLINKMGRQNVNIGTLSKLGYHYLLELPCP
jgi:hypothetical protein